MSEEIANSIKNDLRADFNTYEASNEFSSSPSTESKSSSCRESDKSSSDESDKSSRPISKRKRDHESSKSSSKKTKYCSVVEIDHQSGMYFKSVTNSEFQLFSGTILELLPLFFIRKFENMILKLQF